MIVSGLPAKQPQGIQQIEYRIHPRPPGRELPDRNLPQPISGQTAQLLGCLHLQHLLEMLMGLLDVAQLKC